MYSEVLSVIYTHRKGAKAQRKSRKEQRVKKTAGMCATFHLPFLRYFAKPLRLCASAPGFGLSLDARRQVHGAVKLRPGDRTGIGEVVEQHRAGVEAPEADAVDQEGRHAPDPGGDGFVGVGLELCLDRRV